MALASALRRFWGRVSLRAKTLVVLVLAIGPMLVSIIFLGVLNETDARLDASIQRQRELRIVEADLLSAVVDADTGVRGFLLTQEDAFLDPYRSARTRLSDLYGELEKRGDQGGDRELDEAIELARRQMEVLDDLLRDYSEPALVAEKEMMDEFRLAMGRLLEQRDRDLESVERERQEITNRARGVLLAGGSLSALGAVAGGLLLMNGIVRRVSTVTNNARRLAHGEELTSVDGGDDEIAQLSRALDQSAVLLQARESSLRQAKLEADNANRTKSEFLSRMSHELRTPLNAVLGFAQLLEIDDLTPEQRDSTQQIVKGGRRLLDLINEVLDISRIESGTLQLSLEPVLVAGVVRDSVDLIRPLANERGIRLRSMLTGDMAERHVIADQQRLGQVLLNLLSNAVKYNVADGTVSVTTSSVDDRTRIGVVDTGPGIADDKIERLFTPFERLGAEQTTIEGTGLGLALSKSLVEAMGGRLEVDSMMGEGTTFWVELRNAPAHPRQPELPKSVSPAAVLGQGSVLYIEDNLSNLKLIQRLLGGRRDMTLISAMTGELGLDMAQQHLPDLVLLDLHLPDMRGEEVLRRLRKDPRTKTIPVVILSADATQGQIERLRAVGITDYMTKPIDVARFIDVIERVLERSEQRG